MIANNFTQPGQNNRSKGAQNGLLTIRKPLSGTYDVGLESTIRCSFCSRRCYDLNHLFRHNYDDVFSLNGPQLRQRIYV